MLDRLQYLLGKLAEEGVEIAHISLKTQQFGLDSDNDGLLELTNREHIHKELNDLFAIVKMLNDECQLDYDPNEAMIKKKMTKVNFFHEQSKRLGFAQ